MKNKSTAVLLAFFFGGFGAQHFYLGHKTAGVLSVLFFWTFIPAFLAYVSIVKLLLMSDADFNAKYNS